MSHNGLGQRLSMDAAGVIATYVLDGDRPLTAESNGNTTFYLYGLGAIGEETSAWSYSLPDGTNTPRQLSDLSGEITLSARYTPWGDTLNTFGTGNFTFGYIGGVLDATTGLLYVGNGQYYDPSTGRFLTRDVYPNSPNPYVPWNPLGAILGPLAVVSLFYTRRKKGGKAGTFLVLLIVLGGVGMTLAACVAGPATATLTSTPGAPVTYTATFADGTTIAGTLPASSGAATVIATSCATIPPTPSPTGTPIPTLDPASLPLPDINDIPDLESWASLQVREKTISQYKEMRKSLYEQDRMYIESDGKIRDDVLVALIITAELAVVKGLYPDMYPELLEALSNQYDSGRQIKFSNPGNMRCNGKCTVTTQIQWLYDMEGIRADTFIRDKVNSRNWANYLSDGGEVVRGYVYGQNASWFWGNVPKEELKCYLIVDQVLNPALYSGKPYFIVHRGLSGKCKQ